MAPPSELLWIGYVAVAVILVVLVSALKLRRDVTERGSAARRERMRAELSDPHAPVDTVAHCATGGRQERSDLLMLLQNAPRGQRWSATRRLGTQRRRIALNMTEELAKGPARRAKALLLMGQLSLPGARDAAVAALEDEDGDVRLAACDALRLLGTYDSAEALIAAMDRGVVAADRVIERLSEPWALPAAIEELDRAQAPKQRARLVKALELIADPAACSMIRPLLRSRSELERGAALEAIGVLGDSSDIPLVAGCLSDEEPRNRAAAARTLGRLGAECAIPQLEGALTDSAWEVRRDAAQALARLDGPGRAALLRALRSPDRYARDRAAETLEWTERIGRVA